MFGEISKLMIEKTASEDKRTHLGMIQDVINRMASNSFLFKGWSITIIAAISAFAAKDSNKALMIIPIVSTLLFWAIDGYYLMLERAFRKLYEKVAGKSVTDIDFVMKPALEDITFNKWFSTLKRPVLILFYGVVLVMLIILILVLDNITLGGTTHHGA